MARTIIEAIEESLDPRTVANALYETMVEWRSLTVKINTGEPRKSRNKDKRIQIEVTLARFLGMEHTEVRRLLGQHYGLEVKVK